LRDDWSKFQGKAEVAAVSFEDSFTQTRFKDQLKLPFPLLADPEYKAIDKYGGREPNKTYSNPSAFIVGTDGKVQWSYIGKNSGDRPPDAEILKHFD